MYLAHDSRQETFIAVASEMLNVAVEGFQIFITAKLCNEFWLNVCFEESSNTGPPNGVIRNLLFVCVIEFGLMSDTVRTRCHLVLQTEMKNLDKRRTRSLAGMFTIALDSFSNSQNFVHAFKSLLVLY